MKTQRKKNPARVKIISFRIQTVKKMIISKRKRNEGATKQKKKYTQAKWKKRLRKKSHGAETSKEIPTRERRGREITLFHYRGRAAATQREMHTMQ